MPDPASVWAIIVAGGSGARFGEPKHRQILGGKEVWRHSFDTLQAAGIGGVVVVGDVPDGVPAGEHRGASVLSGLNTVPESVEWVLVHDAARPLLTIELIERVLQRASVGDVDGVIPAIPVPDTLKRVSGEDVLATLDRADLVAAQTPQAFRVAVLRAAFDVAQGEWTDDAGLVENTVGGTVVHVMGDAANLKITYSQDLAIAEARLNASKSDG